MILVSILGDFHSSIFPLFYELKDSISKHVVVYDDVFAKRNQNKELISALEAFCDKHNLFITTQEQIIEEDSYESINSLIKSIETLAKDEQVYINATDGLANITVLLGQKLLASGVKILAYDMYANSYNVTSQNAIEKKKMTRQMSIEDHFLLKGYRVASKEDKSFARENAPAIRELFENYASEYKELQKEITKNKVQKKNYPRAYQLIDNMGLDFQTQQKEITGGLFEWYVYLLVKDLGFSDIEVGVTIEDKFSSHINIRNEFDILLMRNNHLHMIECKFTERIDMQTLVYKYAHLINIIDDDGRVIILTEKGEYAPDLYDSTIMGLEHHRRAKKNRILVRSKIVKNRAKFIEDVKLHFS